MDIYRRSITGQTSRLNQVFALLSDLHIDASDHDRGALEADLKAARQLNARISINGDIFDAILPSDTKRSHHSVIKADPDRDDILNQLIDMAVAVLEPYADLIDVISPGNHERSVLKYHHVDLVSMLIRDLNRCLPEGAQKIHQGSYRGFQQYSFRKVNGKAVRQFVIFRHHGIGGSAPVTGGAIDLYRVRQDFDADLYWIGHKHNSLGRKHTRVSVGTGGKLLVKQQRAVMSAGYKTKLQYEDPEVMGDIVDFSENFYNTTEQGAQWVLAEVNLHYETTSTGFVNGLRWSVNDSPSQLLQGKDSAEPIDTSEPTPGLDNGDTEDVQPYGDEEASVYRESDTGGAA